MLERLKGQCGLMFVLRCLLLLCLFSPKITAADTVLIQNVGRNPHFKFANASSLCRHETPALPENWFVSCERVNTIALPKDQLPRQDFDRFNVLSVSASEKCKSQFFGVHSGVEETYPAERYLVKFGYDNINHYRYCGYVKSVLESGFGAEAKALMRVRQDLGEGEFITQFADFIDSGDGVDCQISGCCDYYRNVYNVRGLCFDLSQLPAPTAQKIDLLAGVVPRKCSGECGWRERCMKGQALAVRHVDAPSFRCNQPLTDRNARLLQAARDLVEIAPHSRTLFLKGLLFEVGYGRARFEVVELLVSHLIAQQDVLGALDVISSEGGDARLWNDLLSSEDDFLFLNAYHHWVEKHFVFSDLVLRDAVFKRLERIRGL